MRDKAVHLCWIYLCFTFAFIREGFQKRVKIFLLQINYHSQKKSELPYPKRNFFTLSKVLLLWKRLK
jgi:hypothetical protein